MRFKTRPYRTLPRTSCDEPVFGELILECGDNGVPAFTLDDVDNTDRFHLVYSGDHEVCLHDSPLNLSVNLIRSCGTPAPIGSYLVQILPSSGIVSQHEYFVSDGKQEVAVHRLWHSTTRRHPWRFALPPD